MAPHSFLTWIIIGVIAGGLAGKVTRGDRYGCCLSLVVGLAGALVGGALLTAGNSRLSTQGGFSGFVIDIAVAFVGSVILLALVRLVFGRNPGRPQRWR